MARELYIYWKAPAAASAQARALVGELQRVLRERHAGLTARLLRRPEESKGLVTWMEVYAAPGGVTLALQAEIDVAAAGAMQALGVQARHVEVFDAA